MTKFIIRISHGLSMQLFSLTDFRCDNAGQFFCKYIENK